MISRFEDEYHFLSNFYPCKVELDGVTYPSTEHAYQAAKTIDITERIQFQTGTAGQAKRNGRKVTVRYDWPIVKLSIMESLLIQKFSYKELGDLLMATGNEMLIEGNNFHDIYWGVCGGVGENHLGQLLMHIRENLISFSKEENG